MLSTTEALLIGAWFGAVLVLAIAVPILTALLAWPSKRERELEAEADALRARLGGDPMTKDEKKLYDWHEATGVTMKVGRGKDRVTVTAERYAWDGDDLLFDVGGDKVLRLVNAYAVREVHNGQAQE